MSLRTLAVTAAFTALLTLAALGALGAWREQTRTLDAATLTAARARALASLPAPSPPRCFSVVTARLARRQTLAQALFHLALRPAEVKAVLAALSGAFPFHRARPGDQLRLERRQDGALHRFTYRQGGADEWIVQAAEGGTLVARKRAVEITTDVQRVAVSIQGSLYETLEKAGLDPTLAVLAADVLAWDVDFYQDVRSGDRMKVLVERVFADGRFLRYGEVLAAQYDGPTVGKKRLFRYVDPAGSIGYFDDDGQSARRGFLRSPLRYAHLTSRFGNRRHPVLQYLRAHQGVDYGAPVGTPVWAVGDGTVEQAGWNGACGRQVTLRHRNGFETIYCHLSRVAVAAGAPVTQKQVVGWVGETGLATGPHLHYAVKRSGAFVNPLTLRIPRGQPVPESLRADFTAKVAPLRARLDADPLAMGPATVPGPGSA